MSKMISLTCHSFFKNFFRFILVTTLVIGPMQNVYSWDLLEENNEFAGVRTHFNPAFGPFGVFFPDDGTQRAQDLLDLGFFGLYIECDTGEKKVAINYQLWNDKDRQWLAQPARPARHRFRGAERAVCGDEGSRQLGSFFAGPAQISGETK